MNCEAPPIFKASLVKYFMRQALKVSNHRDLAFFDRLTVEYV